MATNTATRSASAPRRGFAARLFGYDLFISFALGPAPRGTQSYASDLARRLRERDFTVFFSEDEAPPGAALDAALRGALHRSKALVVIANRGTLEAPRWVRTEVEYFRQHHPGRPIIPVSVGGALQDPALGPAVQDWLAFNHRIWLDETEAAVAAGIASAPLVERLALAPKTARSSALWRRLVSVVVVSLIGLAIGLAFATRSALQSAERARAELRRAVALRLVSEAQAMLAGTRDEGDERAMLQIAAAHRIAPGAQVDAALLDALLHRLALRKLIRVDMPIADLRFAADGRELLAAERDHYHTGGPVGVGNRLHRFALASGQAVAAPVQLPESFHAVDVSADGRRMVSAGESVQVFDTGSGKRLLGPLKGENWLAELAAFGPGVIVAGFQDGSLQRWNAESGETIGTVTQAHRDSVASIVFSRDGLRFATGAGRPALRLWDARTAAPLPLEPGDDLGTAGNVSAIAFSADGRRLVAGGRGLQRSGAEPGASLRAWDIEGGKPAELTFIGAPDPVIALAMAPDGRHLASAGYDGPVLLWPLEGATARATAFTGHRGAVESLAFNADSSLLASGGSDGGIRVWFADPQRALGQVLAGESADLSRVAFSPDGRRIVGGSSGSGGTLGQWDVASGQPLGEALEGHRNMVTGVAFLPDGRHIVSASTDGSVRLWDATTGKPVAEPLSCHKGAMGRLAVSADGRRIAASGVVFVSRQKTLRVACLWDVASRQRVPTRWDGGDAGFEVFALSADGRRMLAADAKGALAVRDVDSAAVVGTPFDGHRQGVASAAFSPDGRRVASADGEGLRLWDVTTGAALGRLRSEHQGAVASVAFSPDGSRLVSGSRDGVLRIWDGMTGDPIGPALATRDKEVSDVAFSPDGLQIASTGPAGHLRLWPAPKTWPQLLCDKLQRNPSAHEWRDWVSPEIDVVQPCPGLPVPVDHTGAAAAPAASTPRPGTGAPGPAGR